MKEGLFFYGVVFIALGLGIKLEQLSKMPNGYIFLGIGFILLIISMILIKGDSKK